MIKNAIYILSVNFNYDIEKDMVIETRCIKREMKDLTGTKKQFIKAGMKRHPAFRVRSDLYDMVKTSNAVVIEKEITFEQAKLVMDKTIDLFDDIEHCNSNNELQLMVERMVQVI